MYKKLLATAVFALFLAPTALATFPDVRSNHINYDAVNYVQDLGIVEGYIDGNYKPSQAINRVEFTKIIIAAEFAQSEIDSCNTSSFSDVGDGAWFAPYVCVAEIEGIVNGYPNGTYQPANFITFAEAAKILTNTLIEPTQDGSDVWYELYVNKLEARNAIPTSVTGFGHNLTRGEMAEMIYRLKENIRNKDSLTYNDLVGDTGSTNNQVTFEVDMENYSFSETELVVSQGETVTITLTNSLGFHNFNLDEFDVASVSISSGQTTEITFVADKVGTFEYYCGIGDHRALGMIGNLIVE